MLAIKNLKKYFYTKDHLVKAVDSVSLEIPKGVCYGLVGESGSGKSTLGRCILRLIEPDSGQVIYDGSDITAMNFGDLKPWRKSVNIQG